MGLEELEVSFRMSSFNMDCLYSRALRRISEISSCGSSDFGQIPRLTSVAEFRSLSGIILLQSSGCEGSRLACEVTSSVTEGARDQMRDELVTCVWLCMHAHSQFRRTTCVWRWSRRRDRTFSVSRMQIPSSILMLQNPQKSKSSLCIISLCCQISPKNLNVIFLYHLQLWSRRQMGEIQWYPEHLDLLERQLWLGGPLNHCKSVLNAAILIE